MKTYLDCYPCFLRQALDAARMAGADERQQRGILNQVLGTLRQMEPLRTPPEIGDQVHRLVRQQVGNGDPSSTSREEVIKMPRGDRTGPMGLGPMTGRAAGYCAGNAVPGSGMPGYGNPMPGRGYGMGWGGGPGRGRRWRHWYTATGLPRWARFGPAPGWGYGPNVGPRTQEQEVESLKTQAGWLQEQLDAINQRVTELDKQE